MTTNKEVLKKLYRIAQNQQKIIRKLAQAEGMTPGTEDITQEVNDIIQGLSQVLPRGTTCAGATFYPAEKTVSAKVRLMSAQPGDPNNRKVTSSVASAIAVAKGLPVSSVKVVLLFG